MNATPGAPQSNLTERATVQVRGEVRELDLATLEQELGIDLDNGLYTPYADQPAIVAQQIQQMPGEETMS